jgi:hypothetical protein
MDDPLLVKLAFNGYRVKSWYRTKAGDPQFKRCLDDDLETLGHINNLFATNRDSNPVVSIPSPKRLGKMMADEFGAFDIEVYDWNNNLLWKQDERPSE